MMVQIQNWGYLKNNHEEAREVAEISLHYVEQQKPSRICWTFKNGDIQLSNLFGEVRNKITNFFQTLISILLVPQNFLCSFSFISYNTFYNLRWVQFTSNKMRCNIILFTCSFIIPVKIISFWKKIIFSGEFRIIRPRSLSRPDWLREVVLYMHGRMHNHKPFVFEKNY